LGIAVSIVYFVFMMFLKIKDKKDTSLSRLLISTSFIVYVFFVIGVTIFPLPLGSSHLQDLKAAGIESKYNFIPFLSIIDVVQTNIRLSRMEILVTQIGGNLLLMLPLGVYVPLIWEKKNKLKLIAFIGFVTSFFIEYLQFQIGMIIHLRYRSVDIDDILLNTLGAITGFFILKMISPLLSDNIKSSKKQSLLN
jgi:glycopeptide antibiotics resistance protein